MPGLYYNFCVKIVVPPTPATSPPGDTIVYAIEWFYHFSRESGGDLA